MSEFEQFETTPDPVLDGYLRSLSRLTPRPGFEDRVMARVRRPLPVRVRRVRERLAALATPTRLWGASGLAAASSVGWTVALASWLSGARLQEVVAGLAGQVGVPAWNAGLASVAAGARMATAWAMGVYQLFGPPALAAGAAFAFIPVLSAWGLYLAARQPRRARVQAYAAR